MSGRGKIIEKIREKFPYLVFRGNNIEEALIELSRKDYVNPSRKVKFPVTVYGYYGAGAKAVILKILDAEGEKYALRISEEVPRMSGINLQQALVKYAMAPELLYIGKVPRVDMTFAILDTINGTFEDYVKAGNFNKDKLYTAVKCLLDKKYLLGFIHGDMNTSNVVILKDGSTLGFIDFEWSFFTKNGELNILDAIPFLGDFARQAFKKRGSLELLNMIRNYYKETFNISIDLNKIKNPNEGGFYYGKEKLNSYIVGKNLETIAASTRKVFPSLKLPKIVD